MSLAVSGSPSLHTASSRILIVQVSPSSDKPPFSFVGISVASPGTADMSSLLKLNSRSYCIAKSSYSGVSIALSGFTVMMLFVKPMMNVIGSALSLPLGSLLWPSAVPERASPPSMPSAATNATARAVLFMPRLLPDVPVAEFAIARAFLLVLRRCCNARLVDGQRPRPGVQRGGDPQRDRGEMLSVSERELV